MLNDDDHHRNRLKFSLFANGVRNQTKIESRWRIWLLVPTADRNDVNFAACGEPSKLGGKYDFGNCPKNQIDVIFIRNMIELLILILLAISKINKN